MGKPDAELSCAKLAQHAWECKSYIDDRLHPKGGRWVEVAFPKAAVAQGVTVYVQKHPGPLTLTVQLGEAKPNGKGYVWRQAWT